jgi:hypothetical protein
LLVSANIAPSSLILFILMMAATSFSKALVVTGATRRNIPKDGIFHSYRSENLKYYIALNGWAL